MSRGQDALIRMDVDLAEAMFGTSRDIQVDTAILCQACSGAGTAPGTQPATCAMCKGRGEIQQVQRSFLGQVMTSRPCPQCQGFGTTIPHPCHECSGAGRVRTRRTLTIQVPPGVDTGTRIQLQSEGEVGPNGGPAGDLFVEVVVASHPVFVREGDDLHCTITVPMTSAALGTAIPLQTLDGEEIIDVRAGTQPGEVLLLRGRGASRLRSGSRGDLHVHLGVEVPTRLSDAEADLLRSFAELRGEQAPRVGGTADPGGGIFSRLKDAFTSK